MATTFVRVPSLEQQYDLWEAGLLFVKGSPTDEPRLVPGRFSTSSRDYILQRWAEHSVQYPSTQFGFMSEE